MFELVLKVTMEMGCSLP